MKVEEIKNENSIKHIIEWLIPIKSLRPEHIKSPETTEILFFHMLEPTHIRRVQNENPKGRRKGAKSYSVC